MNTCLDGGIVASIEYLQKFDKAQFFRFFVDGRFQKKYNGWIGYEARERGSVQALLNGFSFMLDNLQSPTGLRCPYLLQLHRTCMLHVQASEKTAPGDVRYLNTGMPFFIKTTTLEHLQEILEMRRNDGTRIFHDRELSKTADQLRARDIYQLLQKKTKLIYRPWYPDLDLATQDALAGDSTLSRFYEAKHYVQMLIVDKMEEIVDRYNRNSRRATSEEEKLATIALLVRELELLHPFSDGNCRVFANVLLTQLLLYHGFPPAILHNPNLDGELSLKQWTGEIKDGMQRTLTLLEDPTATVCNYSIRDIPEEKQREFLGMAAELIQKIDAYREIFLTPERAQRYTGGYWINGDLNLRFTEVSVKGGVRSGSICYLTTIDDWRKEENVIQHELIRRVKGGVRAFVVDDRNHAKDLPVPVLVVQDATKALEDTAYHVRREANPKTILITGTEGKTGTKIQLHHLFSRQTTAHAILNSANAHLPILRSLSDLGNDHQFELLEFSVDANLDKTIERTRRVNPDLCFFSNIGKEHMHNHKSIEGVIRNKAAVIEGLREGGKCIVNSSLDIHDRFVAALRERRENVEILTYGHGAEDTARLIDAAFDSERFGWNIRADIAGNEVAYFLPMVQHHAPLMSVGILLVADIMGLDLQQAARDYATLQPFESMGQVHRIAKKDGEFIFYDQSRRASIAGIRSTFKDLRNFKVKGKIVALFGSISSVNLNEWTRGYHEELAQLINESNIKRLYTTGANMEFVHDNLRDKSLLVAHSDDHDKLFRCLMSDVKAGDLLVIQGYMRLNLDRIAEMIFRFKDTNKFDPAIQQTHLDQAGVLAYKKLLALEDLGRKDLPLAVMNRYELDPSVIRDLLQGNMTFRQYRAAKLLGFFRTLDRLIESECGLPCRNRELAESDHENLLYNEKFCDSWFNNIDKIPGKTGKQLFGSFFALGDGGHFFFVVVGSTNLHVGFARYTLTGEKYELPEMDRKDQDELLERFANNLPKHLALQPRSWGRKWVTIDCGSFIDLSKPEVFAAIHDPERSAMYTTTIRPLLRAAC
ncbi:MAG: hypothetical protein C4563_01170 [Desulfobulbus sp.]|nr:MAG: hypothetical protein C4563_01170 [Desulfobulbus sp.]